jgi:hypothetical protein
MYTTTKKFYLGTGRRKSSVARVRLCEGTGKVTINGRELEDYFTEVKDRGAVVGPLLATDLRSRVDIFSPDRPVRRVKAWRGRSRRCSALRRAPTRRKARRKRAESPRSCGIPATSRATAA